MYINKKVIEILSSRKKTTNNQEMMLISFFFYKKHRELKKFEDCVAPLADKCQDDPVYNMQVNQLKIFKPACGGVFDLKHLQHLRYMQMHDLKEFKDISKRNFGL